MTYYVNLKDINPLQEKIMEFVDFWVHEKKTPIPLKEIIIAMNYQNVKKPTVIKSINGLLNKGYIRRAIVTSNKSSFVQLRGIV